MAFPDQLQIRDKILMGLSEVPEDQYFLPEHMPCPLGHVCHRHFVYQDGIAIPTYACTECTVTYRYHELKGYEK